MSREAWNRLPTCLPGKRSGNWLETVLAANSGCAYLQQYGSPVSPDGYRQQVPLTDYDTLRPWIERIANGDPSLLFDGRPVAFERTGGSSGGSKLIPYTAQGLDDFRRELLPWLAEVARRHDLSGSAYFSLSPACRGQEDMAGVPVGLSDLAYIGEAAGRVIAGVSAVLPSVAGLTDIDEWRRQTLDQLRKAGDLELISAWSPTFLLRLFEGEDTQAQWPDLKVISCWADAASAGYIGPLQRLFPHAVIEPKGLMSTEAVVTVPDAQGKPVLAESGFVEFLHRDGIVTEAELAEEEIYEAVITTASGLYRYRTGDRLRFEGRNGNRRPILRFVGRGSLVSDLVGEKLTESFVDRCLAGVEGMRMLIPARTGDGYLLVVPQQAKVDAGSVERQLLSNPQYAYARELGQLKHLEVLPVDDPWGRYLRRQSGLGVRLGDIKPVALRNEPEWEALFREAA